MKVVNLGQQNTILNTYVAEIRDARIQKDSMRFRTNLERVGCVFGYEISKTLDSQKAPSCPPSANTEKEITSRSLQTIAPARIWKGKPSL